jgi:predicted 3-demethylubiquinone-9 3-methyltransferase (glyoxalase superfamily)
MASLNDHNETSGQGPSVSSSQKIIPFLWFDNQAEEAANFYTSVFKNSRISNVSRYGDAGPGPKGSAMSVTFTIDGLEFIALNGGPLYHFTPAVSFFVRCKTQQEVDELWDKLVDGGKPVQCGWLTDKFGLSWQIIPDQLGELLSAPDRKRAGSVMQAMMKMIKIDIQGLEDAYNKG